MDFEFEFTYAPRGKHRLYSQVASLKLKTLYPKEHDFYRKYSRNANDVIRKHDSGKNLMPL